jgi:hypothetical protein
MIFRRGLSHPLTEELEFQKNGGTPKFKNLDNKRIRWYTSILYNAESTFTNLSIISFFERWVGKRAKGSKESVKPDLKT